MPSRRAVDSAFLKPIGQLARQGLTDAEIVRALQPLTVEIGSPAPSYSTVRRIAAAARLEVRRPNPYVAEIVGSLLTGRMPNFYAVDLQLALQAPSGPREAINRVRRGRS